MLTLLRGKGSQKKLNEQAAHENIQDGKSVKAFQRPSENQALGERLIILLVVLHDIDTEIERQ